MECSITDGPKCDDEQVRNSPDPDQQREDFYEPEDNFSLDVRLRMAMNRIANGNGYDQRQLIELLKDSLKNHQNYVKLQAGVDRCTDRFGEIQRQAD